MTQQQIYTQNTQDERVDHVRSRPRRRDLFLHVGKTFKFMGALLADRRIALWRKVTFLGCIALLLAILVFPDFFDEVLLSTLLPIIGTLTGIPIDAGFDWAAFALIAVNLLHFFPAQLVTEHYRTIFKPR